MGVRRTPRHYPREWYRASPTPYGTLDDPDDGTAAEPVGIVGVEEIKLALRGDRVRFAIRPSSHGSPDWVAPGRIHDLWKSELQPHLVPPDTALERFQPDDYPGGYCYVAYQWCLPDGRLVVLFEMWH